MGPWTSLFLSPFEKFISKNDIFRLRAPNFLFIDKQQGRDTSSGSRRQTTVIGQIQEKGNSEMVRSEKSGIRVFASIAINMMLLVSVAAGAFYAIAPVAA
jgi:hypothetical protein